MARPRVGYLLSLSVVCCTFLQVVMGDDAEADTVVDGSVFDLSPCLRKKVG